MYLSINRHCFCLHGHYGWFFILGTSSLLDTNTLFMSLLHKSYNQHQKDQWAKWTTGTHHNPFHCLIVYLCNRVFWFMKFRRYADSCLCIKQITILIWRWLGRTHSQSKKPITDAGVRSTIIEWLMRWDNQTAGKFEA